VRNLLLFNQTRNQLTHVQIGASIGSNAFVAQGKLEWAQPKLHKLTTPARLPCRRLLASTLALSARNQRSRPHFRLNYRPVEHQSATHHAARMARLSDIEARQPREVAAQSAQTHQKDKQ